MDQKSKNCIDLNLVQKWLLKAGNDLEIVRQGLQAENVVTDVLCFHCQQVVEKCFKAYLISKNLNFPKTHNLSILLEKMIHDDVEFEKFEDIVYMTNYAVELRYPDDFFIPDLIETQEAYKNALRVFQNISQRLQ